MKKYFILLVIASCFLSLPKRIWATDYYVSTSGNDANSGTTSSPWKTIQKGANTAVAGDTVYVKNDGVYFESVKFKNSGNSGNYIRYIGVTNQKGQKPVIDAINKYIAIQNGWGQTGTGKSYIEVNNFEIRNGGINYPDGGAGIYLDGGAKYFKIVNCDIHDNYGDGISVHGNSYGTGYIYVNNVKSYRNGKSLASGGHGIILYQGGDNSEISDSDFYDNGQDVTDTGGEPWSSGIEINDATNVAIKHNKSYHNRMHGIDVCQNARNSNISENEVYNNAHVGIALDSNANNNTVDRNVVYKNATATTWGGTGGAGIFLWDNVYNNTIVNNTIYGTTNDWGIAFYDPSSSTVSTGNVFKNNITFANPGGSFSYSSANIQTSDYNDFGENVIKYAGSTYKNNFLGYKTASGKDTHSISADPKFVDPANNDFHLRSDSPCIDAGINVGLSYSGSAPDMGALEYGSGNIPAFSPTPTPSSCSLKSLGDFNCDGKINESDLNALLSKWMTSEKDITGDGKTNESDLNKLLGNWKIL